MPELSQFSVGLMHIQLLHTSASLAINENWDPDVRDDMEMMLNRIVPEDMPFRHSCEGPDDMVSSNKKKIRKDLWKEVDVWAGIFFSLSFFPSIFLKVF